MELGNRLLELRKKKGISQEEVADYLGVSRQTVSKWETGVSQPEFDRIKPLCDLYEITVEELITGNTLEHKKEVNDIKHKSKSAFMLIISIFLYFIAVISIIALSEIGAPDAVTVGVFLLICALATCLIIYRALVFSEEKEEENEIDKNPVFSLVKTIISVIALIIYLGLSFITNAWHITWIIWLIYAVVIKILELIYSLKGVNTNEK